MPNIDEPTSNEQPPRVETRKRKPGKKLSSQGWSVTDITEEDSARKADMSIWKDLFVPPRVIQALSDLHFTEPTRIQVNLSAVHL